MATGSTELITQEEEEEDGGFPTEEQSSVPPPVQDGLPQTGPKGVLTDFYRTQQDVKRKTVLEEKRRKELIEKHTATVKSKSEEDVGDSDKRAILNLAKALEEGALDQDPFVQQYRAKRMEEMKEQAKLGSQRVIFGNLLEIRGSKLDSVIESAPPQTFVIIHIYDEIIPGCQLVNKCLTKLAKQFPSVKFCRVQSYQLDNHLSPEFLRTALPCLLVYQGGTLIGNHIRVSQTLKEEFTVEDMEIFLHEHHCLPPDSEKEELFVFENSDRKIFSTCRSRSKDSDSD